MCLKPTVSQNGNTSLGDLMLVPLGTGNSFILEVVLLPLLALT